MGIQGCSMDVINANFEAILLVAGIIATVLLWLFTILAFLGLAILLGVYLLFLSIAVTAIEFSLFVEKIMVCAEGSVLHKVLQVSYRFFHRTNFYRITWEKIVGTGGAWY